MATQFTDYSAVPSRPLFSWSGIFAGTFLFLAIEATFGILGVAIFASATNPRSANPVGEGISAGVGIWMVILSIIALYFAGKLSSKLSGSVSRNTGMYCGLVTFGMCIFTAVLLTSFTLAGTVSGSMGIGYAGPVRMADILTTGGYWLFVALVLAMISAASGGIHGALMGGDNRAAGRPADVKRVA